ncbi:MAG: cation:proton antiporter [Deltaproteobacteria bacterium]|nr:cation:proton antiporter [Deltaproteobacteria bacterium]
MTDASADLTFALALLAGVAAHVLARHLRLPSIVLLLFSGALLGPDGLGWIRPDSFGEGLSTFVSLAVAVILFEGGLGLDLRRLRAAAAPVRRLVSWGSLVTLLGGGLAAFFLMGWPADRALLYGALVIVTGPTVVRPILRLVPVRNRLATVLEAEGLLIDPVGAIVAAIVLEVVLDRTMGSVASGAIGLIARLSFGAGAGFAIVGLLALLLRLPRVVPVGLENLAVLGGSLAGFAVCESILPESGILAVIVAAAVVGHSASDRAQIVGEFQEHLTIGLIGMLFVLLAADVRIETVIALGWPGVATVATLAFVVRPVGVLWATKGSDLTMRERFFAAWLGPRGVVAAAIASVTATALDSVGVEGGAELRALVFLTIALTVIVLGGLAPIASWALGVRAPGREVTVVLGCEELALALGEALRESGDSVVFADRNPVNCRAAEERGFPVVFGDVLAPTTLARLRLERARSVIGLTTNPALNQLFVLEAQQEFDVPAGYIAIDRSAANESARLARLQSARVLFDRPKDVERWNVRIRHQLVLPVRLRAPRREPVAAGARESAVGSSMGAQDPYVILAVRRDTWRPMDGDWEVRPGDEAIALFHRDEIEASTSRLRELGWEVVAPQR